MGQDITWGGKKKMPGEDEVKETEDGENECTAEPPFPKPKKMGHSSPSWVTQARGISPWLLGNERHREGGGTDTEGKGVFSQLMPQLASPVSEQGLRGEFQVPVGAVGTQAWPHPAHPHRGVR